MVPISKHRFDRTNHQSYIFNYRDHKAFEQTVELLLKDWDICMLFYGQCKWLVKHTLLAECETGLSFQICLPPFKSPPFPSIFLSLLKITSTQQLAKERLLRLLGKKDCCFLQYREVPIKRPALPLSWQVYFWMGLFPVRFISGQVYFRQVYFRIVLFPEGFIIGRTAFQKWSGFSWYSFYFPSVTLHHSVWFLILSTTTVTHSGRQRRGRRPVPRPSSSSSSKERKVRWS